MSMQPPWSRVSRFRDKRKTPPVLRQAAFLLFKKKRFHLAGLAATYSPVS